MSDQPWLDNPLPPTPPPVNKPGLLSQLGNYALHDSIPSKMVQSAISGFKQPGDVLAGKSDPMDIGRALDFAGLATGGAGVVPAGEGAELRAGLTFKGPYSKGIKTRTPMEEWTATYGKDPVSPPQLLTNPEDLQGSTLVSLMGDRTISGNTLTGVNGMPFSKEVQLQGGPGYMRDVGGWASQKGAASKLAKRVNQAAESGDPVNLMYTTMGERSGDFSHMTTQALREMMQHAKVKKADIKLFDKAMRAEVPDFPGVQGMTDEWIANAGGGRAVLAQMMNKGQFQQAGLPEVAAARYAVTDPLLRNVPSGQSGFAISRIGPEGMKLEPGAHQTYDTAATNPGGSYLGGLEQNLPYSVAYPEWWQKQGQFMKDTAALDRSFLMQAPTQKADQQWLDGVMKFLENAKR